MLDSSITYLLSLDNKQDIVQVSSFSSDSIGLHISALLNTKGGFVVCEITDVSDIKELKDNIEAELQGQVQPNVLFSFEIIKGNTIVIEVPVGKDKPYSYNNDIFVRDSATSIKADINSIKDMILFKQTEPQRWERRSSELVTEDDLSISELKKLLSSKRIPVDVKSVEKDILQQLQLLSLAKYKRLTNAGDILLSKNPVIRHPQALVRAVAYNDKFDDNYKDFRNFEGPLLEVLESVLTFIGQNTPMKASFSKDSHTRVDSSLYPMTAIREGLVNAFAHRDYSNSSGGILVEISKNEVKIWNSGSFPEGIDEEKLKKGSISILRNPDLAHILYIREYMERLGRGSAVIQEGCEKYGLPEPKWTSDEELGVTLTFFAPSSKNAKLNFKNLSLTLNVDFKILKLLSIIEGEESRPEIQNKLQLKDDDTVRNKYINPALDLGLIERTIPDKKTSNKQKYRLAEKGLYIKNKMLMSSNYPTR
jgi:ATP-dependent DNA helicase RecG